MTSEATRRYEWMPKSTQSRQATLSLLQRSKSAILRSNSLLSTPRHSQAPPAHHVSFKMQPPLEMSQLSLDSSLQQSLISKTHSNNRNDSSSSEKNHTESRSQNQGDIREVSDCRFSAAGSEMQRSIPLIPHGQRSTFTSASQSISGSSMSVKTKEPLRNGRGAALQRAKQQAMQTSFNQTAFSKRTEHRNVLPSHGSVCGASSFSRGLLQHNPSLAQKSLSSNSGRLSEASLGSRSVVTMEPEQFVATKASLKIEFQRFVEEKEAFLKKKEDEMLANLTDHAKHLTNSLVTTTEQGKTEITTAASSRHFESECRREYMKFHRSKMEEAQNQISSDMDRAKMDAIEELRFEQSSILNALEIEKKDLLATGKDIIAQAIQAKDTALASINKFHSGAIRSISEYLKRIATGKKVAEPTRDDLSVNFVATPRKKRSPISKPPMSAEKAPSQDVETHCSTSFEPELELEERTDQDLIKKRRRTAVSKSKQSRKNKLPSEPLTTYDMDNKSTVSVKPTGSERRSSQFKLISPSSTAVKSMVPVPVVSNRKQKRFAPHFQGRSKRARVKASTTRPLDFKDDVTFSFRGF